MTSAPRVLVERWAATEIAPIYGEIVRILIDVSRERANRAGQRRSARTEGLRQKLADPYDRDRLVATIAEYAKVLPHAEEIPGWIDLRGITLNGLVYDLPLVACDFSHARSRTGKEEANPFIVFQLCTLDGSRFSSVKTELGIQLQTSAVGCDFTGANLRRNNFEGSHVRGSRFDEANLSGARFHGNDLSLCSFRGSRLRRAYFGQVTGPADFTGADMVGCEVEGALPQS